MTRILIIEDEESYREALAYMLRKEGFEIVEAPDGTQGLAEYDRVGADLVLLDLMMPGLPGTEVCRQLRLRGPVPVIMVTARDSEVDKVVGLELGADDYVTKPFSHRELVARIRAVLRRGQDMELLPDVVEAGAVRMDVERHEVSVNGQRTQDNNYTIDGIDNNMMFMNSPGGSPPMDSIQEFRVATGNSAE